MHLNNLYMYDNLLPLFNIIKKSLPWKKLRTLYDHLSLKMANNLRTPRLRFRFRDLMKKKPCNPNQSISGVIFLSLFTFECEEARFIFYRWYISRSALSVLTTVTSQWKQFDSAPVILNIIIILKNHEFRRGWGRPRFAVTPGVNL